jgi:glutamate synthase (NADPH/NADH) small chain
MLGVFAGGDIVTGAATVIEAMGAGRRAARSMKAFLKIRDSEVVYRAQGTASAGRLFGMDPAEANFARLRVAGAGHQIMAGQRAPASTGVGATS